MELCVAPGCDGAQLARRGPPCMDLTQKVELRPGNLCNCLACGRLSWEQDPWPLVALLTWVPCLAPCDLVGGPGGL